jgi:fucose 4-O-acetylase-like acetyltransferase
VSEPSIDEIAARTPVTRDRYVDFLRAVSILAVVFGHWFIEIIRWRGGILSTTSAVGVTRGMWLGTWFFQVMPIFFFVGGFSNMVAFDSSRRRGESTGAFVRSRISRLLRPSIMFLGIWVVVQVAIHLADIGGSAGPTLWGQTKLLRGMQPPAATLPFGPLWFLAVYLVVVSISPWTIALHRRFRLWIPAAMIAGTIAVDLIGFGWGLHGVRYLNVVFVLLLPHQLGHFYADGSLPRQPRWVFWSMVAAGLGVLVVLTNPWVFQATLGAARFHWFPGIGYYPKSLLGTDVETISNAYPPTACFMAASIWSVGAVMLLRPKLSGWLQKAGPWKATISVNGVIMTLFLWHMTAYLLAILGLWPLRFGHQTASTARWWLERPVWIFLPSLVLFALMRVFGRFERGSVVKGIHRPIGDRAAPTGRHTNIIGRT